MQIFERWYFGLCWKVEISYRVYKLLKDFGFIFEDFLKIIFLHFEIFEFP
jgi:hypothetical protein